MLVFRDFAVIDGNLVPILGAFVTVIAGFYAIAKIMLSQAASDRDADRSERQKLAEAIDRMANAQEKSAQATSQGFSKLTASQDRIGGEAERRNGHLGELILQQGEQIKAIAESSTSKVVDVITNVQQQHIEHAHIEHEHIENRDVVK